jgi:hypothetical protein
MPYSASRKVVDRKSRLAGNGPVLVTKRNAASDYFSTRPKGAQMIQSRVAALEKGHTIPCGLRLVLHHLDSSEYGIFILKGHQDL